MEEGFEPVHVPGLQELQPFLEQHCTAGSSTVVVRFPSDEPQAATELARAALAAMSELLGAQEPGRLKCPVAVVALLPETK